MTKWVIAAALVARAARADADAGACVDGHGEAAVWAQLAGTSASFCFQPMGTVASCYAVDVQTGALTAAKGPAQTSQLPMLAGPADAPLIVDNKDDAAVCRGTACKTIKPTTDPDPGIGMTRAVDATGTYAALGMQAQERVDVFEVASGKHAGTIAIPGAGACIDVDFAGDALVVASTDCATHAGNAWLATRAGKRIAALGGKFPMGFYGPPAHVTANKWAFGAANAEVVVVQDVVSGSVWRRFALDKPDENTRTELTLVADDRRVVAIYGGDRAGDLALLDIGTHKITRLPAKRCAKAK